jgi:DNA repair protein RadA/Sms
MQTNKSHQIFLCNNCGETFPKWSGSCPNCGEWNTLVESKFSGSPKASVGKISNIEIADINTKEHLSYSTHLPSSLVSWDHVLSGGIAPGQVILFSGDPGIGKSTLLLQIVSSMNETDVLYFSGEETTHQVISRAKRIGNSTSTIFAKTKFVNLNTIEDLESIVSAGKYQIVIVDSIQTISSSESGGFPGSVNQVRECTIRIAEMAKKKNICFIIVGQVTKEGDIAGPKLLEHLVDTVLYLEGEKRSELRILRVIKNRYGSTNEIAFYEMQENGLREIDNPSSLIIDRKKELLEGSCYSLAIEGNIPIILEIQALCNKSVFNYPKFVSTGYPLNRLQMLTAIITKRTKINLSEQDIYLNIIGGLKINDPQVDIGVCIAIASSFFKKPIDKNSIFYGELGLTGEIRLDKTQNKRSAYVKKNKFESIDFNTIKSIDKLFSLLK